MDGRLFRLFSLVEKMDDDQKIEFGIKCVKKVYKEPAWNDCMDIWFINKDKAREIAKEIVDNLIYSYRFLQNAKHPIVRPPEYSDFCDSAKYVFRAILSEDTRAINGCIISVVSRLFRSCPDIDFIKIAEEILKN